MPEAGSGPDPVVRRDGAETAERRDEHADHARAEESRPPMIEVVVEAAVEMLEDPAEEQREHQEEKPHRGYREEDRERVQCQEVHVR